MPNIFQNKDLQKCTQVEQSITKYFIKLTAHGHQLPTVWKKGLI